MLHDGTISKCSKMLLKTNKILFSPIFLQSLLSFICFYLFHIEFTSLCFHSQVSVFVTLGLFHSTISSRICLMESNELQKKKKVFGVGLELKV